MPYRKATLATLKDFYVYKPETGFFYRKRRMNCVGTLGSHGYWAITIDGKTYLAHRLAWYYMTGEWPQEIDHIDRCKTNNKWDNLRETTRSQNNMNLSLRSDNTSGAAGVIFHPGTGKWRVRILGKSLGLYTSKDEAVEVARQFRQQLETERT